MANEPIPDNVEAPVAGEPEITCQAILGNRMQCKNKAFVYVDGIAYCRLHFNWEVGQGTIAPTDEIKPIDPEDASDVKRILDTQEKS